MPIILICLQTITMFDKKYRMRHPRSEAKDVIATVTTKIGQIGPGEEGRAPVVLFIVIELKME